MKKVASQELHEHLPEHTPPATIDDNAPLYQTRNYYLMIAGVLVIVIGYFILGSEPYIDLNSGKFSVALTIAPWVIIGGYAFLLYAIMYRPKS